MFKITGITGTDSLATQEQLMYNKYSSEGQQAAGLGQLTAHFLWNLIWCSEFWHSSAGPDGIRHRHTVTSCKCWTQLSNVVTIIISTHPSELVNSPCEVQMVWEATPMSGTNHRLQSFHQFAPVGRQHSDWNVWLELVKLHTSSSFPLPSLSSFLPIHLELQVQGSVPSVVVHWEPLILIDTINKISSFSNW